MMRQFLWTVLLLVLAITASYGQTFTNIAIDDAAVLPGALIVAQIIEIKVPSSALTVTQIVLKNTATSPVRGNDLEYIEIRRGSQTGTVLKKETTLTGFEGTNGVTISITANNTFSAGTHRLYILAKLKTDENLVDKKMALGGTKVNTTDIDYTTAPAAVFTVVGPVVSFDSSVPSATVYRGQRFLAARIEVDNQTRSVPFQVTISQVRLKNVASEGTKLSGAYIQQVEILRATDSAVLGSSTNLTNFTTTGTVITTSANNTVGAYSKLLLEIWVTLKGDAPNGHVLQLQVDVRCGGTDFQAQGTAPKFTVGLPIGFEDVKNLVGPEYGVDDAEVFSGQRFLAQRIQLVDTDPDPYNVTINSLVIQNVIPNTDGDTRLAEGKIALIEIIRARDGALLGKTTSASGINSGGVRIVTSANNVVADDTEEELEIWITLATDVPANRTIKLVTVVWHTEDATTLGKLADTRESAVFTTSAAGGTGFKEATSDSTLTARTVYQGGRFLAARLKLKDDDTDPYDVTIVWLMVRNKESQSPLADQHVARIEVRRRVDNALLGELMDPVGLTQPGGVRVSTTTNNVVADDTSVEIEIWVTLKESAPAGRKLIIGAIVWHTEGSGIFKTDELAGPTITTALGEAPRNVDFSWTPEKPEAGKEVTFTPSPDITDPSGNISQATFRWEFGDGQSKETTGPSSVKHTYTKGGTFSVKLTVTNTGGLSASKTKEIEVIGKQPTVNFTFTPAEPTVGETVTFTATITDPATPPLSPYTYKWDFGDGNTITQQSSATQQTVTHSYTSAGTFTVTLEVTNSRGETGKAQKQITVGTPVARPPTVTSLTASTTTPAVGENVTFTATATTGANTPITGWKWDFGDGTPVQ
ncbi:MAG: PKD domain-containing protein, partial [Thermofilum sp.]|uniref:PKD domain-containing protein n=1 Tax=Thermofilum sp. TaxID=1961369 RepID=UPI00317166EE